MSHSRSKEVQNVAAQKQEQTREKIPEEEGEKEDEEQGLEGLGKKLTIEEQEQLAEEKAAEILERASHIDSAAVLSLALSHQAAAKAAAAEAEAAAIAEAQKRIDQNRGSYVSTPSSRIGNLCTDVLATVHVENNTEPDLEEKATQETQSQEN